MQIGLTDIPKVQGLPKAYDYNKLVDIVNILRKINLGPNMVGNISQTGVSLDSVPNIKKEYDYFPYGDRWAFGLQIINSTIRIYNPLAQRQGVMTSNWLTIEPTIGVGIPDKVYLEAAWNDGSFEVVGNEGKFIVYYEYDTANNTEAVKITTDIAIACTLPTEDGAGLLDPLRYYKTPLYTIIGDKGSDGSFSNLRIWQDFIHGMYVPQIM